MKPINSKADRIPPQSVANEYGNIFCANAGDAEWRIVHYSNAADYDYWLPFSAMAEIPKEKPREAFAVKVVRGKLHKVNSTYWLNDAVFPSAFHPYDAQDGDEITVIAIRGELPNPETQISKDWDDAFEYRDREWRELLRLED